MFLLLCLFTASTPLFHLLGLNFGHSISAEDSQGTIRIYQGRDGALLHTLDVHSAPVSTMKVFCVGLCSLKLGLDQFPTPHPPPLAV